MSSKTENKKEKGVEIADLLKRLSNLEQNQEALTAENEKLNKQNNNLSKALKAVESKIPQPQEQGRPKPTPSKYKSVEVTLSIKGEKTKKIFEINEAYRKENKVYNPVSGKAISVDDLVDNAINGDATIIKKIIALQEESKTPFETCVVKPKED